MTRPVARLGDLTSYGGIIITSAVRTHADGRLVARLTDLQICPLLLFLVTPIITGSVRTITEGLPTARIGDMCADGSMIVTGAPRTLAG